MNEASNMNAKSAAPKPEALAEEEPFIPYVREEDFTPALKRELEPYKKRLGVVTNAARLYAHRPEIAETLWKLCDNVMRDPSSTLDRLLKRRLGTLASAINGCAYCTAHGCAMLKRPVGTGSEGWGFSDREVQDTLTGAAEPKDEFERVCFDYVRAASEDPNSVAEELLQRLKRHLTPPQIIELACVVGFWKFYNTVHDSLHIPIESQLRGEIG